MPIHQTNDAPQHSQENETVQRKEQAGDKATKQGQKPAIQARQTPIQAKQKPVQAKQTPIQRNTQKSVVQRNGGDDLKERMSSQYKVDLSGYKEHPNSSFPASVGAEATIQGNNIHYGPGKFTEQNRKHELGHAIDNTLNGTPKGDKVINGQSIDTTREAAADKIMNTPLQAKAEPVQMKTSAGSSSDQPLQLKYEWGKATDTLYVHKSNYKDVQGGGMYIISERPTEVTVKDGVKDTIKPGTVVEYDKNYTDESGMYIRVRYTKGDSTKIGFVEAGSIERFFTKKEKKQLLKEKKKEEKKRNRRLQKEKKIRTQNEIQQEKQELVPFFRDEANVGVEVEMRNVTIIRNDKKHWKEDGEPVDLTTGGPDGSWVTDQQAEEKAIIEWNTDHPKFKDSNYGATFQEKLDRFNQMLDSTKIDTLGQLVQLAKPIMDVGTINKKYDKVSVLSEANKVSQTQVNMEVPLANIGKIPQKQEDQKHDSANMFSGGKAKKSKDVFVRSRKAANNTLGRMLEHWNEKHPQSKQKIGALQEVASTLTIFLYTGILNGHGGTKDSQGVLFKTGAGDLVRTALDSGQKKFLWYMMNETTDKDFYISLCYDAIDIYKHAFESGVTTDKAEEVGRYVYGEAKEIFKAVSSQRIQELDDLYENEDDDDDRLDILSELITALSTTSRWGDEHKAGTYGDSINSDVISVSTYNQDTDNPDPKLDDWDAVDEYHSNINVSGVSTGKDFPVTRHEYNGKHIKGISIPYILAEIRHNDNDLNKLVRKSRYKLKPEKLKKIQQTIKDVQTIF